MKRILFFVFLILSGVIVTAQPTSGLVGFFKFNGSTSNTGSASISASTVNTTYSTNSGGSPNSAIQFGGSVSSYSSITDNGNLDFSGDFSISFGIFMASTVSSQGIYDNGLNYGGCGIWYFSADNTLRFNFKNGSIGAVNALPANQWKVVCAVRSGSTLRLYVDGVEVVSGVQGTSALSYPFPPVLGQMYFAGGGGNYNPILNGSKIDEMRFYSRALSAAEVSSLTGFTLPLELTEFNGRIFSNNAVLNWKTTGEQNTESFDIERSTDGRSFTSVGNVAAVNRSGDHNYSYADNTASSLGTKVVYYRLKQKDTDGRFAYSRIINLRLDNSKNGVLFYPNPVIHEANLAITVLKPEIVQGKIIDQAGRVVKQQQWSVSAGTTSFSIDLNLLAKGTYFLELKGETIHERKQFVKQ